MVMVKVVSNVVKATNRDEGVYWRDNVGRKVEATTASEGRLHLCVSLDSSSSLCLRQDQRRRRRRCACQAAGGASSLHIAPAASSPPANQLNTTTLLRLPIHPKPTRHC